MRRSRQSDNLVQSPAPPWQTSAPAGCPLTSRSTLRRENQHVCRNNVERKRHNETQSVKNKSNRQTFHPFLSAPEGSLLLPSAGLTGTSSGLFRDASKRHVTTQGTHGLKEPSNLVWWPWPCSQTAHAFLCTCGLLPGPGCSASSTLTTASP